MVIIAGFSNVKIRIHVLLGNVFISIHLYIMITHLVLFQSDSFMKVSNWFEYLCTYKYQIIDIHSGLLPCVFYEFEFWAHIHCHFPCGYEAWINDVQSIKGFILLLLKTWVQCYPGTTLNYNLRFSFFQPHRYLGILSNYSLGAEKDFPEKLCLFVVPLRVKANTDSFYMKHFHTFTEGVLDWFNGLGLIHVFLIW